MNWEEVSTLLQQPLDPSAIKPPPKGKFGEYVDALHVIREANRIFGEGGWSYTVTRLEKVSEQTVQLSGSNGPYEQFRVGYLASVVVDVAGVKREGCAVGMGNGNPNSMADQHESAVKEAETDALKRALRSFGNTFGLALYDKDKNNREVGKPEMTDAQKRDIIKGAISKCQNVVELDEYWKNPRLSEGVGKLPEPMRNELQKAYTDRMAQVYQAPPPDEGGDGGQMYQ